MIFPPHAGGAKQDVDRLSADLVTAIQKKDAFFRGLVISSPVDGIFTDRRVSQGADVIPGQTLAHVMGRRLYIRARLFLDTAANLVGKKAEVILSPIKSISATVKKIIPQRAEDGATIAWITGNGIDSQMKAGEIASGSIVVESREKSIAVPDSAVIRDAQEKPFVFVAGKNGAVRKQAVVTGVAESGLTEIVSGISAQDEIVCQGGYELFHRDFNKTYKVAD